MSAVSNPDSQRELPSLFDEHESIPTIPCRYSAVTAVHAISSSLLEELQDDDDEDATA